MKKITLASASLRRRELMAQIGLQFDVFPSQYQEDNSLSLQPDALVRELALGKAKWVAEKRPDHIVIGADTIIVLGGTILGKPADSAGAMEMLRSLSGKTHSVYSGFAIVAGERTVSEAVETQVRIRNLSEGEIRGYVARGESLDKAGSYGIQSLGALLIDGISGDYYTVVGLPLNRLAIRLREFGIELLDDIS